MKKGQFKNYLGKKFNSLLCTRHIKDNIWEWTCDCGNLIEVLGGNIHHIKSCGCVATQSRKFRGARKRTYKSATINYFYNVHKSRAKTKKILPLSREDWESIVFHKCEYCGDIDIKNVSECATYKKRRGVTLDEESIKKYAVSMNGVDRVDSSKDYTLDNCVPCCKHCNTIKMHYTKEQFLNKIEKIYNKWIK